MLIKSDNLTGDAIIALLQQHLHDMHLTSPPESVHALDLTGLRAADVSFWTLWLPLPAGQKQSAQTQDELQLAGCGALKQLDAQSAEIKSMRTADHFRRQGIAAAMLTHLIAVATERGYQQLYLETGSMAYFAPARALYQRFGFEYCDPFADYVLDPNSVFMVKQL
ncbi:GNAT family N-acetyltransferase [Rheinheimera riviphila]|uniref:GNAT family N-acetyltransferase n=1 Tax=Rheinheimera riviphila TaxID=1834037 RepID=A0A437R5J1_9GAMM|nr:GNAT family N-acetyltransferase [Rheinheimera riviphila]RVU42050.1 GNAT family N-acetyltransferase [Rheinheimera riviphila]